MRGQSERAVIVRYESSDDRGTPCSSLFLASAEPPTDPESRIVIGRGRLLAEAHPERCEWVFTAIGQAVIEIEARAEIRREIREEIADEMRGEAFDAIAERSW